MPYSNLPASSYWKRCLRSDDFRLNDLYQPRFQIGAQDAIATAGSCFAQRIGQELRHATVDFLDLEPPPPGMSHATAQSFGFGIYSARYGNIYTPRQLLQLVEDVLATRIRPEAVWESRGAWFDGLRPQIEPGGFASADELVGIRVSHLDRVRQMIEKATVFFFTLGLTECWAHAETGTVFPVCPSVVPGVFDPELHRFRNLRTAEVIADLEAFMAAARQINPGLRFLFTVSPVPLVATATGGHVLAATTRSKSVLRAAVAEVVDSDSGCDYFPSYELATTHPILRDTFCDDRRSVRPEIVRMIMDMFFAAHPGCARIDIPAGEDEMDAFCDELLLDAATS
ncbi:GSCFA domain-containing protein [Plastorhodobacter daqingensis]|uniref:GSCFA domain-containing protein n=1 Tax=Plastorhodobacter daqingensis TaxID=1387281 RepID=A0ABW2UFL9_9RHOB